MVVKGGKSQKAKNPQEKTRGENRTEKAGLNFPIGKFMRQMREMKLAPRISSGAPVYIAAVIEYLTAELLELSGNATKTAKKARISPRAVFLAMKEDEELDQLLSKSTMISTGGVKEHIDPFLNQKKGKKANEAMKTSAA